MKKISLLFLKIVIVLIATGALIWIIMFPQLEGRAKNLDLISIYTDPLIIYAFIASVPFFAGLYQTFKLLNYIDQNKAFSQNAVNTLRKIKLSALTLIGFIALGELILIFLVRGENIAGPAALGIYFAFAVAVVAAGADVFQRLLKGKIKKS